jgi:hypothetical protein
VNLKVLSERTSGYQQAQILYIKVLHSFIHIIHRLGNGFSPVICGQCGFFLQILWITFREEQAAETIILFSSRMQG